MFGKLAMRSTEYQVSNSDTPGIVQTYSVPNGIDPDWAGSGTYRGAMGIPACWRAACLLSDLLGLVPWYAYNEGSMDRIEPTPELLTQPSPPDSRVETISAMALDYLWEGNSVSIIAARGDDGEPTAIAPQPAELIAVRRSPVDNRIKYRVYTPDIDTQMGRDRRYTEWDQSEVLHIKGPHKPGALRGMGVLEAHFSGALTLSRVQQKQALDVVQKSGVPTGLLTSESEDLEEDDLKAAKESWLKAQSERTIAALGWGTKFQPVSWNPEQQQLIEARTFSLTEAELMFGLPPGWLGGMNSARQYSNIEQDAINLLKFTMGGHYARFEQKISLLYPNGVSVQAEIDEISRADTLTRYQGYQLGVDGKWMAPSEVRTKERMPALTAAQKAEIAANEEKANDNPSEEGARPGGRPPLHAVR